MKVVVFGSRESELCEKRDLRGSTSLTPPEPKNAMTRHFRVRIDARKERVS
jgi:hypothetical protein